jgi:hypothetical protein
MEDRFTGKALLSNSRDLRMLVTSNPFSASTPDVDHSQRDEPTV